MQFILILFAFDQALFAVLVWVSAMIISIIVLPRLIRFQVGLMREVDDTSPLKVSDFLKNSNDG